MCIRDSVAVVHIAGDDDQLGALGDGQIDQPVTEHPLVVDPVSYTHLRAHETVLDLVCRLLLEKKKATINVPLVNCTRVNITTHNRYTRERNTGVAICDIGECRS